MRAFLILVVLAGSASNAWSADRHLTRVAEMMLDKEHCSIPYDPTALRTELVKGSMSEGNDMNSGMETAINIMRILRSDIVSSVGFEAYCSTKR